jgi:hypothetical protein
MLQLFNCKADEKKFLSSGLRIWKLGATSWKERKWMMSRTLDFGILVSQHPTSGESSPQ